MDRLHNDTMGRMSPTQARRAATTQTRESDALFQIPAHKVPALKARLGEGIAAAVRAEAPNLSPSQAAEFGDKAAAWAFSRAFEVR